MRLLIIATAAICATPALAQSWEHCESIEKEFNSRQAAQPPIPPDFSKRIANKIKGDAK